jgi:methyl-accepting chemotaxis protein
MSFLSNLPIRVKLALLSLLPLALLGGLVAGVMAELAAVTDERAHEQDDIAVERRVRDVAVLAAGLPVQNRALFSAQEKPEIDAIRAEARRIAAAARAEADLIAGHQTHTTDQQGARDFAAALGALEAAVLKAAELRAGLIAARDDAFFPAGQAFEMRFEAVFSGVELEGFDQGTLEELRTRLLSVNAGAGEIRLAALTYLATGDGRQTARIRRSAAAARTHMRGALSVTMNPRMQGEMEELSQSLDQLIEASGRLGSLTTSLTEHDGTVTRAAAQRAETLGAQLAAGYVTEAQAAGQEILATLAGAREFVLALAAMIAAILVGSALLTGRIVARPVTRLTALLQRVAAGDTGFSLAGTARRDEFGRMQNAVATLRGKVETAFAQSQMLGQMPVAVMVADPRDEFRITYMNEETRRVLGTVEHLLPAKVDALMGQSVDIFHRNPGHQRRLLGDPANLPHRARIRLGPETMDLRINAVTDADGGYVGAMLVWSLITSQVKLADTFETSVAKVARNIGEGATGMKDVAEAMSETASDTGKRAVAVSAATEQASANVQTVAASAEELAASVQEISRQVSESAAIAAQAAREAGATDQTVAGLSEAASRIGDVVRLIGDIAGQTNLLALNATIEAARAGEAGKGFAVVASEVKNLAGQTAKATDEIAAQIASMQQATGAAVTAIRGIGGTITRMNEIASSIAAAVEEQGAATGEIARSVQQAAAGTSEVSHNIGAVSAAIDRTGDQAAQVLDSANGLTGEAATLVSEVERFLAEIRSR